MLNFTFVVPNLKPNLLTAGSLLSIPLYLNVYPLNLLPRSGECLNADYLNVASVNVDYLNVAYLKVAYLNVASLNVDYLNACTFTEYGLSECGFT